MHKTWFRQSLFLYYTKSLTLFNCLFGLNKDKRGITVRQIIVIFTAINAMDSNKRKET